MFENKSGLTLVTAVGTPLDNRGDLVEDSFRRHLADQVDRGRVDGLFVLGSMGMMQALTPSTCRRCVEVAVDEVGDRARIMVGVGDTSIERTLDRVNQVKDLDIDAIVATAPYFFTTTSQKGLVHYFTAVADASPFPLYLYDLPQLARDKIAFDTMRQLSEHDNIVGAKLSHDPAFVRRVHDDLAGPDFEVLSAMFDLIDVFLTYGIRGHLDGFFTVMSPWLAEMKSAWAEGDSIRTTQVQRRMTALRNGFLKVNIFAAFTEAMNLLGFEGRFHPLHVDPLSEAERVETRRLMKAAGLLDEGVRPLQRAGADVKG